MILPRFAVPPAEPRVTILIKALNEESRIAACLEAALHEAQTVDGDVLLVDSLSIDRTVTIARQYPVRIVQFSRIEDRSCGAAVQLGYQHANAPFVYVLDADMVLQPGFLAQALGCLEADKGLAGVGGKLRDTRVFTADAIRRAAFAEKLTCAVEVDELGGGGLYRVEAIRTVGYLANRWLAAYEEADLGMRLRSAGWRLLRLPAVAVMHEGHTENDVLMLRRLWRQKRAQAGGALLRNAWHQPWFHLAVRKQAYILSIPVMYVIALLAMPASLGFGISAWIGFGMVWVSFYLLLAARQKGLRTGLKSLYLWHFFAVAAVPGWLSRPRDPFEKISASVIGERASDQS